MKSDLQVLTSPSFVSPLPCLHSHVYQTHICLDVQISPLLTRMLFFSNILHTAYRNCFPADDDLYWNWIISTNEICCKSICWSVCVSVCINLVDYLEGTVSVNLNVKISSFPYVVEFFFLPSVALWSSYFMRGCPVCICCAPTHRWRYNLSSQNAETQHCTSKGEGKKTACKWTWMWTASSS